VPEVAGFDLARAVSASKEAVVLRVHVQPGAKSEGLAGAHGAALKVRVCAPASSGRANAALLRLLSRELGVPASSLSLRGGGHSRDKAVAVAGMAVAEVQSRLAAALARAAAGDAGDHPGDRARDRAGDRAPDRAGDRPRG